MHMTILQHIVWMLMQQAITWIQHSFAAEGLHLWCVPPPGRVTDPAHPQRLLHLSCFINGVTGWAHPATVRP